MQYKTLRANSSYENFDAPPHQKGKITIFAAPRHQIGKDAISFEFEESRPVISGTENAI